MNFGANKTPIEAIREGTFGDTYFRDIYSSLNGKWHKKPWKEFNQLKKWIRSFIAQIIIILLLINMVLNVKHR